MKSLLALLLSVTFFYCHAQTTYPSGVTGCIARYDFTIGEYYDSLPDVSGNGHNGAIYNLTNDSNFRNVFNTAMHFNGYSAYAQVANSPELSPEQVTIIAVVKLDTFYSGECQISQIIIKGYPYFSSGVYYMGISDAPYSGNCSSYYPEYEQLGSGFGALNYSEPIGNFIQLHQWYFYATTYDGSTIKDYQVVMDTAYYDSSITPIFSQTVLPTPIGVNDSDIIIGHTQNPLFPFWVAGGMDELALFNKVLTDSEIQSVYNYLWGLSATPTTGILNMAKGKNIQIFPNPNKGNFTIQGYLNTEKEVSIEIRDLLGQVVYAGSTATKNNQLNKQIILDAGIANGIYLLYINSDQQSITQRLVISK